VINRLHREASDSTTVVALIGLTLCAAWFGIVFWWALNL
jgi:hypothetical protein